MSLERDLQSKIAVLHPSNLTITKIEEIFSTDVIDTLGFRNFTVCITPASALITGDVYQFVAEESADGITYTDVSYAKYLPTRNINYTVAPYGQFLFNALNPYYLTFGLQGADRYVKIGINCTDFNGRQAPLGFGLTVIMESEDQCFIAYESDVAVPGDNLP